MNCLLSHDELVQLLEKKVLEHSDPELVNSASVDIRLGCKILVQDNEYEQDTSLQRKESLKYVEYDIREQPFYLAPGEFILAQSVEIFNLPNDLSAEYKLKSSMARIGLDHLNAGWCDAGWHGSVLTLELKNVGRAHIELNFGDRIGQVIFFRHAPVPADRSYATRGRYNKNLQTSAALPDPIKSVVFDEEDEESDEPVKIDLGSPFEDENYDVANKD